jgi:hypothetical protein
MKDNLHSSSDYISLETVKNAVAQLFRFFYRSVNFLVLAIRRRALLFLACIVICLSLAYLYTRLIPNYYQTEMIVQPTDLTRKAYAEIIFNLNSLISSHSYADLAAELKLKQEEVSQLNSIEAFSIGNEDLTKDTISRLGLPLKIQIRVKENSVIPTLQKGVIGYLNNNPYIKQMRESQKMVFLEKLAFIDQEQIKLDSLKDNYNRSLANMRLPTNFYNNGLDPAAIYKHSLDLASQRQVIKKWLSTEANGMMMIDGFKTPEHPQSLSRINILLIGMITGILLGLLLCILYALKGWVERA